MAASVTRRRRCGEGISFAFLSDTMLGGEFITNPDTWFARSLDRVRTRDWIIPFGMVLLSVGLAFSMEALDEGFRGHLAPVWWVFSGGQQIARQFLSAMAAAMVAILTMAFSITVTALTFIGQYYGSQVLRSFMRDLTTQIIMGNFLATFVYALLILRTVHNAPDDTSLPRIAVTIAILLAVISLCMLIYFLYHLSERMDAPNIVAAVGHDLDRVIYQTTRPCPEAEQSCDGPPPKPLETLPYTVESTSAGYIQRIDEEELVQTAASHRVMVRLQCRVGSFVTQGDTLATMVRAENRMHDALCRRVRTCIRLGAKRTLEQDVEFGIDQLAQVAIRGLSPDRNDAYTVILCLDRLAASLSLLAKRTFPPSLRCDSEDRPRLWICRPTFPDLVDRAFGQIHSFGSETLVIAIRLLKSIETIARRVRRAEDREALRRHAQAVHDRASAHCKDSLGIEEIERVFVKTLEAL